VAAGIPTRIVVTDANIIINLIHAGRLGLMGALPPYEFVVPEDVVSEITDPDQRQANSRPQSLPASCAASPSKYRPS